MARTLLCLVLHLTCSQVAFAQTVTEADYLAGALAGASTEALAGPISTAQGNERSARLLANPVVAVDREAPGDAEQITYTLSWVPPLDGRRGPSIQAAEASVRVAQHEYEWRALEVREDLRAAYAAWALAAERARLLQSQLTTFRTVVAKARERTRIGEESGLATERLSLALVELEANSARADADLSEARAVALGRTTATYTEPAPALPVLPAVHVATDSSFHPLLLAERAAVDEADARRRLSGRFFSSPELYAGWQTLSVGGADTDGSVLGGSWALPLFDRRQGERREAEGQLRAARAHLDIAERNTRATLAGALAKYERLRTAAEATTRDLAGSERVVERATARFQLGESDVTDLLDAVRSVVSSRITALELYGAALEAHRRLELAAGRTLEEGGHR